MKYRNLDINRKHRYMIEVLTPEEYKELRTATDTVYFKYNSRLPKDEEMVELMWRVLMDKEREEN